MRISRDKRSPLERIEVIDAVRGFALFGLFLVHCVELFELYWANPTPSDLHDGVMFLFSGKSFALFGLSFGVSFSIIMRRAQARGEAYQGRFLWRLALLVLFGLFHSLFYRGDILVILAVFGGSLLILDRIKSASALFALAGFFILNPLLIWRVLAAMNGAEWAVQMPHFYHDPGMPFLLNGTFLEAVRASFIDGNIHKTWFYFESGRMSQILGLFAAGLALGRIHFFERQGAQFMRVLSMILIVCGGVAWAIFFLRAQWLAALPQVDGDFTSAYLGMLLKGWGDVAFMAAQLAGFLLAWHMGAHRVLHWLAAPGRMTLSLYIGQSLVFVPLLYGFGLGLYDEVSQSQMVWIGVAASIVQIIGASLWMRSYRYGPFEWVWRVLTKLSLDIPLRIRA